MSAATREAARDHLRDAEDLLVGYDGTGREPARTQALIGAGFAVLALAEELARGARPCTCRRGEP